MRRVRGTRRRTSSREVLRRVEYHGQVSDDQPTSRRAAREAEAAASRRRPGRAVVPASPVAGEAPPKKTTGIAGLIAKHPTASLMGALAIVFVLLGTGAVFAGVAVGSAAAVEPTPTATPDPPRDLPDAAAAASRFRTCSVAGPASDPILMSLTGIVQRADTGEVLWDHGGETAARTASLMKILTASAAISVLTPDYRIATDVYAGSAPGSIVLVGHGDATLSALPPGQESVYQGAPKLADLAAQTLSAYSGPPITSIILDATYWNSGDRWDPSWARSEQTQGYQSEVTALQVDGDRADPTKQDSPRSTDPIGRAGDAFLEALREADTDGEIADDVTFSLGAVTGSTPKLGEVMSQPVSSLITYMLQVSDNTLAEMLARITSKQSASNGSAASLQQAIPSALARITDENGEALLPTGVTIIDGSGESANNAVPPAYLAKLLRIINTGSQHLDVVKNGLPIAGQTGTLAGRFKGDNAVAKGQVIAKTGWITTSYSLAGIISAADGTQLTFAFYAIGDGIQSTARTSLDTLTTAVFRCGDNLSNN